MKDEHEGYIPAWAGPVSFIAGMVLVIIIELALGGACN